MIVPSLIALAAAIGCFLGALLVTRKYDSEVEAAETVAEQERPAEAASKAAKQATDDFRTNVWVDPAFGARKYPTVDITRIQDLWEQSSALGEAMEVRQNPMVRSVGFARRKKRSVPRNKVSKP